MDKGGRPKGSTTRPQIRQFMKDDDIRDIMAVAISKAKKGDVIMAKFLLEQVYGKAAQSMDLTTKGDKIIMPIYNGQANVQKYESDKKNIQSNEENKSSSGGNVSQ